MVNQSHFPEVSEAELKEMQRKIGESQNELKEESESCRVTETRKYSTLLERE